MARRRPSSDRWLREHHNDPFVQAARKEGYRSRAVYKLIEIQEKFSILKSQQTVVDLGAAPGGWSQIAGRLVGDHGRVVAVDLLEMESVPGVVFIQGDFLDDEILSQINQHLAGSHALSETEAPRLVNVVLSDMAPNMSGMKAADQARGELLAETAFEFADQSLRPGGAMVIKLFHGPGFHELVREARTLFEGTRVFKPKASRARSAEQYLVATGFKGNDR
ncbi:MAG: RlmE family RNA methyltransferase [Magnetococcales bacterium]|nr:RlmE family RNA methyltransferase [Magnetococcales bacterium]